MPNINTIIEHPAEIKIFTEHLLLKGHNFIITKLIVRGKYLHVKKVIKQNYVTKISYNKGTCTIDLIAVKRERVMFLT
jgi:hypothetical protein